MSPRLERHRISIDVERPVILLEKLWKDQFSADMKANVSIRTLQRHCRLNMIPGAQKIGRKWWINLIVWTAFDSQQQPMLPEIDAHFGGTSDLVRDGISRAKEKAKRAKTIAPGRVGDGMDDFDTNKPSWAQA